MRLHAHALSCPSLRHRCEKEQTGVSLDTGIKLNIFVLSPDLGCLICNSCVSLSEVFHYKDNKYLLISSDTG